MRASIRVGFDCRAGRRTAGTSFAVESGAAAALLGPVLAVVGGGIAAIAIVGVVAMLWPQLARVGPLHTLSPEQPDGTAI